MKRSNNIFTEKHIIENILKGYSKNLDSQIGFYPPDIRKMLKYIHNHLFENTLTINEVKNACQVRNNNITTKFRMLVGSGTREYVINQRLKAAETILREREVNIYLLANIIGYTEEAFSKLFKRVTGDSPLQYREKVLREMDKRNEKERILRNMDK